MSSISGSGPVNRGEGPSSTQGNAKFTPPSPEQLSIKSEGEAQLTPDQKKKLNAQVSEPYTGGEK